MRAELIRAVFSGAVWLWVASPAHGADIGVDVEVRLPGVRIHIGERRPDGRYWDGEHWRDPAWWHDNCPRFENHKDFRGHCDAPPRGPKHCPPGQAKKGNC
ncbi:MAG: DUF2502 domain-containing protein [Zoogloeaceae bacterium]|nr:DUF2502 domain-containing protein [Rhodocyclaceae bacterium]MCP5236935.1 DUF2502 domain-containing protein [Zoogloeaceae bacterium]